CYLFLFLLSSSTCFFFFFYAHRLHRDLHSFPTRRSSDLCAVLEITVKRLKPYHIKADTNHLYVIVSPENFTLQINGEHYRFVPRSEEHTSELQSRFDLVCRLLLEKKKVNGIHYHRLESGS